jgi:hypothetical protein
MLQLPKGCTCSMSLLLRRCTPAACRLTSVGYCKGTVHGIACPGWTTGKQCKCLRCCLLSKSLLSPQVPFACRAVRALSEGSARYRVIACSLAKSLQCPHIYYVTPSAQYYSHKDHSLKITMSSFNVHSMFSRAASLAGHLTPQKCTHMRHWLQSLK